MLVVALRNLLWNSNIVGTEEVACSVRFVVQGVMFYCDLIVIVFATEIRVEYRIRLPDLIDL